MLLWSIDETSGFDTAWASTSGSRLRAEGHASGLASTPYWVSYVLETADEYVTARMTVQARWADGSATLDLRRDAVGRWTVNGEPRPDLDSAVDCDLGACPLTNTMPILRHDLNRSSGDHRFTMAFIEVPSLRVVASQQRYTHLRTTDGGGAIVQYRSGSFQSDLKIDADGFVLEYPQLGRRVVAQPTGEGIRLAGPGSARPG